MRYVALILVLLTAVSSAAHAGRNAGGAIVVHTNDALVATHSFCTVFYDDPGSCENAGTRSDHDGYLGQSSVIWFLAAFFEGSLPSVTACTFGNDHNLPENWVDPWGFCGPTGTFETPDGGWPWAPTSAGNTVTFGSPKTSRLFPIYWFVCYSHDPESYFGSGINPTEGHAGFWSDDNPPVLDETSRFGQVHWFDDEGFNDCPDGAGSEACCLPDGSCVITFPESCPLWGGESQGPGSVCDPNPCPQPPDGACCLVSGACLWVDSYECEDYAGEFHGPDVPCDPNPCPQPGACCHENGDCIFLPEWLCDGNLFMDGTPCDPNPCTQPPGGACCFEDTTCQFVDVYECADIGGEFLGDGTTCDPNPCGGACCFYNGVCTYGIEGDCTATGGTFQGDGTVCDPNPCPQPGACCFGDGTCTYTLPDQCAEMGGEYIEAGLDCYPNPCGATDIKESRTITTTWGRVKAEYR